MPTTFRPAALLVLLCGVTLVSVQPQPVAAQSRGGTPAPYSKAPIPNAHAAALSSLEHESMAETQSHNRDTTEPEKSGGESTCFLPPLAGVHGHMVGFAALKVQAKAQADIEKACKNILQNKFDVAEKQLSKTVEKHPEYSVAWVLLGQLQQHHKDSSSARNSCLQAASVDSSYVPAHLCLADIATQVSDWNEVLKRSILAITLDPTGNRLSYLYNAGANLYLGYLDKAKNSALKGIDVDNGQTDPRFHYLLAQIYEEMGDRPNQVAQLREAVKLLQNSKNADSVKQEIAAAENGHPGVATQAIK